MDFLHVLTNKERRGPDKEWKGALTQQVFRAVCVIVVVVRKMVDSETAALIDACRTKRNMFHINYSPQVDRTAS